ncbi:MAG: Smr/MutS family protein [Treponema sp.]|jgi:DNA-nicking Smr family endonuclease|nr:Smr/MutS family protein [Treponema sp.]
MNFGDILDKWEKQRPSDDSSSDGELQAKDTEERGKPSGAQEKRRRLRNKKPDAELDIHGQTRDEAWLTLETFFNNAKEKELEKVLIIHGKGNHSADEPVLKRVVMDFIERCPFAGESGKGKASAGGEGATWVLLKESKEEIA